MDATRIVEQAHYEAAEGGVSLVGSNPWSSSREAERRDRESPRAMKDGVPGKVAGSAAGGWDQEEQQQQQHQQQQHPSASGSGGRAHVDIAAVTAPVETSQLDPRAPVRKGKWTPEEEVYTTKIINDFNKGLLPLAPGTTLRSYLSEKLNCDPMRITKKFAGASCIGKRVFMPVERTPENIIETHRSRRELEEMARKFHIRLESMRPGAGRLNSAASKPGSLSQSSPKTRRSTAQAAGVAPPAAAAAAAAAASARRSAELAAAVAAAATRGVPMKNNNNNTNTAGGGGGGGRGRTGSSRSPSPGAHGPHSACDDSAPHPEGSPGRRSAWEREEEGYGHYDPMDQSPSGADTDGDSNGSPPHAAPYPGGNGGGGGGGYGDGAYGAGSGGGDVMGYSRCQYEGCPPGEGHVDTGAAGSGSNAGGGGGGGGRVPYQQPRHHHHQEGGGGGGGGGGGHCSRGFQYGGAAAASGTAGTASGSGDTDDSGSLGHDDVDGGGGGGVTGGRMSPLSAGVGGRVGGAWGGLGSPSGAGYAAPSPTGAPRTLPPAALAAAAVIREGSGSGARSPTWPLPRVIPEGSEISDQDAGGLLIDFFRSVQDKVKTASDELDETPDGEEPSTGAIHPLMASKRGFRSISSPALTQFANYAEQLPRLQTPPFKRRKSVSSFV